VTSASLPPGYQIEPLKRSHPRKRFHSGNDQVDQWLATKALQNQEKNLSITKVLLDSSAAIAGYYTLATGNVDFSDLPPEITKRLPRRTLPVAVLAWLGVSVESQGMGLGRLLLAQALRDCYEASRTFAFVAVILDCVNDEAKHFYQHWGFRELPGWPYRMFLSAAELHGMMEGA
jgi:GNAT superfamily N-acetyltransferase